MIRSFLTRKLRARSKNFAVILGSVIDVELCCRSGVADFMTWQVWNRIISLFPPEFTTIQMKPKEWSNFLQGSQVRDRYSLHTYRDVGRASMPVMEISHYASGRLSSHWQYLNDNKIICKIYKIWIDIKNTQCYHSCDIVEGWLTDQRTVTEGCARAAKCAGVVRFAYDFLDVVTVQLLLIYAAGQAILNRRWNSGCGSFDSGLNLGSLISHSLFCSWMSWEVLKTLCDRYGIDR